jgi:hypothetical protein
VEEPADRMDRGQLVAEPHRFLRLGDVCCHASLVENRERSWIDLELELHALGQDDDRGAMEEEVFDVFWLNAGAVTGAGLRPVPLPAPSREIA